MGLSKTAILLAAGRGTRMGGLTEHRAKPLLPLGGRALLDHALDRLVEAGIERVVVNAHWQADQVAAHLAARVGGPQTLLRREATLLDTGGAVAAALTEGLLGDAPFFVVNGDTLWLDGPRPTLARLAAAMTQAGAAAAMLLHRAVQVHSETGMGDFLLDPWGVPRRRREREIAPYVYAGITLAHPSLFAEAGTAAFSMNAVWDRAIAAGGMVATVHDGLWYHLARPEDLAEAEHALHAQVTGATT